MIFSLPGVGGEPGLIAIERIMDIILIQMPFDELGKYYSIGWYTRLIYSVDKLEVSRIQKGRKS
jgi:hypothetical protein